MPEKPRTDRELIGSPRGPPAENAGLEADDIIIDTNGFRLETKEDLVNATRESEGYLEMKVFDSRRGPA